MIVLSRFWTWCRSDVHSGLYERWQVDAV